MVKIDKGSMQQIYKEGGHLLEEHYQELARDKHVVFLNPDWARYFRLEATESLFAFTAYEDDVLVGYCVFFVSPHLHYKDLKVGVNDVMYLQRSHRKGMTGVRLISFAEKELQKMGVRKVSWRAKPGTPLYYILRAKGCTVEDIVLTKVLGD